MPPKVKGKGKPLDKKNPNKLSDGPNKDKKKKSKSKEKDEKRLSREKKSQEKSDEKKANASLEEKALKSTNLSGSGSLGKGANDFHSSLSNHSGKSMKKYVRRGTLNMSNRSRRKKRKREEEKILRKYYSLDLIKGFGPIRYFSVIFGKWPFSFSVDKDFTCQIRVSFKAPMVWYFCLISLIYLVLIVHFTMGFIIIYFRPSNVTNETENDFHLSVLNPIKELDVEYNYEKDLILSQYPIFLLYICWLVVSFADVLEIMFKGNNFIHIFNYWNRAIQVTELELRQGLRELAILEFFYLAIITSFLLLLFFGVKEIRQLCGLFVALPWKIYKKDISEGNNEALNSLGFFLLIFTLCSYRASIMMYLFLLKLLRNITKGWDERLVVCLEYGGGNRPFPQEDVDITTPPYLRINYKLVLKDHLIIAQLYKMHDTVSTWFLCAYFGMQELGNNSMEIIFPSGSRKEIKPVDHGKAVKLVKDSLVCIMVLFFTIFETFATSYQAHITTKSGENGFRIARRHGFLKTKSATERNFMYNLLMSFAWKCSKKITAGGFFYVDKRITISISKGLIILFLLTLTLNRIHLPLKQKDPNASY